MGTAREKEPEMANYTRYTVQAVAGDVTYYLTKHAGANGKMLRDHVTTHRASAAEYLVDESVGINQLAEAEAKRDLAQRLSQAGWTVLADA